MTETTYNKYKRQNKEMKGILSIELQRFILDRKDFGERIKYLSDCISLYRHKKLKNQEDDK